MNSKPITGAALEEFRIGAGLTVGDMCHILGVSRPRWNQLIREKGPVKDPTVGMVIRLYSMYPQLCPIQPPVSMKTAFEQIAAEWRRASRSNEELTTRTFALLSGREPTASYRWFGESGLSEATSTPVRRLIEGLLNVPKAADVIQKLVQQESQSRGVDPVRNGTWRKARKKGQ